MIKEGILSEGYERALELLYACVTPAGFVATPSQRDNYQRVWSRDGVILGLAALQSGKSDLIDTFRQTLKTLVANQGPHGEIPSNVDPLTGRVSYGGTTGRVDAGLWFLIGCAEYLSHADREHLIQSEPNFVTSLVEAVTKAKFLYGAWEFNNRGLLYVPQTGDWADEYVQSGYVLYDQLLYWKGLKSIAQVSAWLHGSSDHTTLEKASHLKHLIRANYWFTDDEGIPEDAYHEVLYENGRHASSRRGGRYWSPFFSPFGYGYRFDTLANVLASLFDIADDEQRQLVDAYIDEEARKEAAANHNAIALMPAFWPAITEVDRDWEELQTSFSYTFKNKPYEFQNAGLWPMVTGFYVADLMKRGRRDRAELFLRGIHRANSLEMEGEAWSFPEYVHGRKFTPGGNRHQGWSAAAAVIGRHALEGKTLFDGND